MRRLLALFALSICSGCANSGPTGNDLITGSIGPNTARLIVYRVSPMGLAIQPDYVVNGQPVAASHPNGFIMCDLPAGRHVVAVNNLPISQNLFGVGSEKLTVDMRPGTTSYIHAQVQMGLVTPGAMTLMQVAEAQGRTDVATLHKIEGNCRAA